MSQQPQLPEPFRAFTEQEKADFEACVARMRERDDMDASIFPYPDFHVSTMFYLWQQATREAKQ